MCAKIQVLKCISRLLFVKNCVRENFFQWLCTNFPSFMEQKHSSQFLMNFPENKKNDDGTVKRTLSRANEKVH